MNKKIPLGVVLTLLVVCVGITAVISIFVITEHYSELIKVLPERASQYQKLSEIEELVRSEYYGNPDSAEIDKNIAKGFVEGLQDEYSFYISPEDYSNYNDLLNGKRTGIGASLYYDTVSDRLLVGSVEKFSSAESAGLKTDDIIKKINGETVTAQNSADLIADITNAQKGSTKLEIANDGDEKTKEIVVQNGYRAVSCTHSVSGDIGYIRIYNFYEYTSGDFSDAVNELTSKSVKGIILDLRNNYSSNIEDAVKLLDLIVPVASGGTGALATAKNSDGEIIEIYSSDSNSISIPFAVLINDRTEGAAELVAADLRDFGKAKLFGEKTAGHGTLQKVFNTSDGGALFLTVAEIIPYISGSFNKVGVSPDAEIYMESTKKNMLDTLGFDNDEQYQNAYSYLSQK